MESWGNSFLKEVIANAEKNVDELDSLMRQIGVDDHVKLEWITFLKENIQECFTNILDDVKSFQNNLIDSIEELLQQLESLCKRLRIKMPPQGSSNLSLSEEKKLLKSRIIEYECKIKEKLNELDKLRKRQANACKSLGYEPKLIEDSPYLPTMEELDAFANHVDEIENEKFKRETKYLEIKCKILEIVQEMGIEPSLEIEKNICSPDDSLFLVNDYNMKWLDEYYESLVRQKIQTENEISMLREKVTGLWGIISEDIQKINDFTQKYTGNSLNTLFALQNEVKRCENLKKANIEKFIKKMRSELVGLWDKCHYAHSEREKFEFFHDNLFTEDLLTFHDFEVENMKKYYEKNKDILLKLERREQYWKRNLELEERSNDPGRFKNRGGTLLKEERERNALTKKITDMEIELLELAAKYEEEHGEPFLSWGRSISDIIEETMQQFENNKRQQLSAKKLQRAKSPTPSKPGCLRTALSGSKKNLLLTPGMSGVSASVLSGTRRNMLTPTVTTPALAGTSKRKLPPSNLFSSGKRKTPKQGDGTGVDAAVSKAKPDERTHSHQKKLRYSFERKRRLQNIRRLSRKIEERRTRLRDESMDYADFKNDMNDKEKSCRSTLFDGPSVSQCILAAPLHNTPRPQRTPNKSPALTRTPTYTKLKTVPGSAMNI